jgi:hypothetical protein
MRTDSAAVSAGDARSLRRWPQRVALPILIRHIVIIVLVVLLFGVWLLWSVHQYVEHPPPVFF